MSVLVFFFFFFQAEDGIRDVAVTGVQTCALPISCFEFDPVVLKKELRPLLRIVLWHRRTDRPAAGTRRRSSGYREGGDYTSCRRGKAVGQLEHSRLADSPGRFTGC